MQIPLDYYRILGLPIAASHEQLQQAYGDRLIQLPRREYSQTAIAARQELIEQAYAILSDAKARSTYDASYFAHSYEYPTADNSDSTEFRIEDIFAPHTPTIDIADELFVGALLILQELGEYELVVKLGSSLQNLNDQKNAVARTDIILTVALAYLELGREQWQQKQYENAAAALENGQQLLTNAGILASIKQEIQADLDKLRPYRILPLLGAQGSTSFEQRRLGLHLLQVLLDARGGIDGSRDDGSGLSLDDFLRFIQQLRSYLTVTEQQNLFAAESKRPSAVATYLFVYALIARGFSQRMPVLISQAKQLLQHLGRRQDVYLEQATCALLLGQTTEATQTVELSQEYEPLGFIQEHSRNSPDLLPGLCLYTERWLQTEVFPQFRDLNQQQASLKDYFADQHVQTYLEALPSPTETNQQMTPVVSPASTNPHRQARSHQSTLVETSSPASPNQSVALASSPERVLQTTQTHNHTSSSSALERVRVAPTRRRNQSSRVPPQKYPGSSTLVLSKVFRPRKTRLALLALAGLIGSVFLFALLGQAFGWLRQTASPPRQADLLVQLNQPPIAIPQPGSRSVTEPLDPTNAQPVIENWLAAKTSAFSAQYTVQSLEAVLVDPALSQWQKRVSSDRTRNRYRQFQHSVKVNSVQVNPTNPNLATVQATVNEVAQIYENGRLNQQASYADQNLRVRYDLVRTNNEWRIRQMQVLN